MSQDQAACPAHINADDISPGSTSSSLPVSAPVDDVSVVTLKRRASESLNDGTDDFSRKRMKEDKEETANGDTDRLDVDTPVDGQALVNELDQELQCGCCSGLVYRPVIVQPCQHFFCGSCCILWIRNGGTNCPACRGIANSVTPSRALQSMMDLLLRHAPHRARPEGERLQADEIYNPKTSTIRIPAPRDPSPEPTINQNSDYARPCPHCLPGNPFGWRCPEPIVDPNANPDRAWHLDDGSPPGHGFCGNCENLLALNAPTTTKCDLCQVSFCGIGVQGRCIATSLLSQHLHEMSDIGDLIQSSEVYECFDSNTVEVDIMIDYLQTQGLTPRHIYRDIVTQIQAQPRGFAPLIELDLFVDVHGVTAQTDPDPTAPRNRICRLCATEVFLWGLRDWWVRERRKGFLEESIMSRPDCSEGSGCQRQKDMAHAKEFNHIIANSLEVQPGFPTESGTVQTGAQTSFGPDGEHPHVEASFVRGRSSTSEMESHDEEEHRPVPSDLQLLMRSSSEDIRDIMDVPM